MAWNKLSISADPSLQQGGVRHLESWRLLLAFFLSVLLGRSQSDAAARSLLAFPAVLVQPGEGSGFSELAAALGILRPVRKQR
jgi:hypothetical protein